MSTEKKGSSSDVTEVALNSILREHYQKELSHHVLNETFQAHPTKMSHLVSDKPNRRGRRFLDKDEALLESFAKTLNKQDLVHDKTSSYPMTSMNASLLAASVREREKDMTAKDKEFQESIKYASLQPKGRYSKPMTAGQEYGWFAGDLTSQSRFYKPKASCEETKYADALIRSSTIGNTKKEAK